MSAFDFHLLKSLAGFGFEPMSTNCNSNVFCIFSSLRTSCLSVRTMITRIEIINASSFLHPFQDLCSSSETSPQKAVNNCSSGSRFADRAAAECFCSTRLLLPCSLFFPVHLLRPLQKPKASLIDLPSEAAFFQELISAGSRASSIVFSPVFAFPLFIIPSSAALNIPAISSRVRDLSQNLLASSMNALAVRTPKVEGFA